MFIVQVEGECFDGEELRIQLPAEEDISKSIVQNKEEECTNLGRLSLSEFVADYFVYHWKFLLESQPG